MSGLGGGAPGSPETLSALLDQGVFWCPQVLREN